MSSEHGEIATTRYNMFGVAIRHMTDPRVIASAEVGGDDVSAHVIIPIIARLYPPNHRSILDQI